MELKQKVQEASDILEQMYGSPQRDTTVEPLDCLIRTILSQNTNDVNRDRAYDNLCSRFPTWEDVMTADVMAIEEAIRVGGLSRQKSERIKNFLVQLHAERGGLSLDFMRELETNEAVEFLCQYKGIGIKTAYVTLAFALGREVFPVDTHILRIARRLGVLDEKVPFAMAHEVLGPLIQPRDRYAMHVLLIAHGRAVCKAARPLCGQCRILQLCPHGQRTMEGVWNKGQEDTN